MSYCGQALLALIEDLPLLDKPMGSPSGLSLEGEGGCGAGGDNVGPCSVKG